jgi:pyruvate dehydrogenase E2 component (dihydrolipoamide acetyltransferase)
MSNQTDQFRLPDLGEGLVDAEIVAWHVNVGDRVVTDQPLLSVETDKAIVEIPAPFAGSIAKRHGAIGERVAVGDVLVEFGDAIADAGAIVGRLKEHGAAASEASTQKAAMTPRAAIKTKASPAVRRLAQQLGVDLSAVQATGPEGSITSNDVESASGRGRRAPASDAANEIRGVRRAMAERMSDAHRRVVPATVTGEADVHAWAEYARPLDRLVRAVGKACTIEPRLNAAFDDERWLLFPAARVDLGIAMDTDEGLFVPVLRDVTGRSANELEAEIARLEVAVRERTIDPAELRGQSISLSNFGAFGGLHATMVVVPPQVAIVGAGRIFERIVAAANGPEAHRILPLSITIDHRVVTGVEACRFLVALATDLELAE